MQATIALGSSLLLKGLNPGFEAQCLQLQMPSNLGYNGCDENALGWAGLALMCFLKTLNPISLLHEKEK